MTPSRSRPFVPPLLVLACLASFPARAGGDVATEDGLRLVLDGSGRVVSLTLNGRELVADPGPLLLARVRHEADRADNLLPGGEMEDVDGDGTIDGWTRVHTPPRLAVAAVPRSCAELPGEDALRFQVTSDIRKFLSEGVRSAWFPVAGGTTYRVTGWACATRGYLGFQPGALQESMLEMWEGPSSRFNGILVQFADADSQVLGDPVPVATTGVNARACKRVGGTLRAPAAAAFARVEIDAALGYRYATDGVREAVTWDEIVFAPAPDELADGAGDLEDLGNVLRGTLAFGGTDLAADVTITGFPDRIRVDGTLRDLRGTDRAVELSVGLPLAPAGFRFADEPRGDAPLAETGLQGRTVSGAGGAAMPISLYPLVAVDEAGTGTLALHVPRETPRFYRLRWDADAGRLEAVFLLGLSPAAGRTAGRATFRLEILAAPAGDGWRGAWEKTRRIHGKDHPSWFRTLHRDPADYGLFHQEAFEEEPEDVREDDASGDFSAEYVLVDFDVDELGEEGEEPPDYDALMRIIDERKDTAPTEKERAYYRTADVTLARDHNGDRILKHLAVKDWTGGKYEADLMSELDPAIEGGMADWLWHWKIEPAMANAAELGACLDGIELDNLFLSNVNYDIDHLALAEYPLTFTESSLRPGRHSAGGLWRFLSWLRGRLDEPPGGCAPLSLSGNWWAPGTVPVVSGLFDFFVGEGSRMNEHVGIWRDDMLLYRRAISWDKGFGAACKDDFGEGDEEAFRQVQEKGLLYAVKVVRWKWAHWADSLQQLADELYNPLAVELHRAGWHPVTRAAADVAGIHVERYGTAAEGNLRLATLNRTGEEASYVLTLEKAPLGIAAVTEVRDLVRDETLPFSDDGDTVEIDDTLPPDRGRLLALTLTVADADGDGAIDAEDCAATDPGARSLPGEVEDLNLSQEGDGTRLAWSDLAEEAGPATFYDVASGDLGTLLAAGDFAAADCAAPGLADPTWTDDRPGPGAGAGTWYLVRARNACGTGPWGYGSDWLRRALPECP